MSTFMNYEMHMDNLQQKGYLADNKDIKSYQSGDYPGGMICSPDPSVSHIPPRFLTIKDIDTLKSISGIPDSLFTEGGIVYEGHIPPLMHELGYEVDKTTDMHLCRAFEAYLSGNSQDVSTWKDTINKYRFPLNVPVYDFDELTVQAGHPVTFTGTAQQPFGVIGNKLIMEPNAQIIYNVPGTLTIKVGQSADTADSLSLLDTVTNWVSRGASGGPTPASGSGADSSKLIGAQGSPAVDNGSGNTCTAAGQGKKGPDGGDATDGGLGAKGGDAPTITNNFGELNGSYLIGIIPGSGGTGGAGGNGGGGGIGGPGGIAASSCVIGLQGPGGAGGKAGNGGPGGPTGDGKNFYINYSSGNPVFNQTTETAIGASGGGAGIQGAGGPGIPPGDGGDKIGHVIGGIGGAGTENPGTIFINGKPH